jgi:hypothetical protein
MMAKLKFLAPLVMAGAAATAIAAAPVAAADMYATAGMSMTQFAQQPGGDGCLEDGTCGWGGPDGGGGCTTDGVCGSGGPWGGGGCVPGVGCFHWGQ